MSNHKNSRSAKTHPSNKPMKEVFLKVLFPHRGKRGRKEYFTNLILRGSFYLSLSYGISIFFSIFFFSLQNNYVIENLVWSPDEILFLPFSITFEAQNIMEFINGIIINTLIPFFIAGLVTGIVWEKDAIDLVLISSLLSFLFVVLLYISQIFLFTTSNIDLIASILPNFLFFSFIFMFTASFLIFSAVGGYLGTILGRKLSYLIFPKKGSKVVYSPEILPETPVSVVTIFDRSGSNYEATKKTKAFSMIYLNRKLEAMIKIRQTNVCPYFEEQRCSYLGYKTASHKLQICVSGMWSLCKVYAFIQQSESIIEEVNRGEIKGEQC